MKIQWFAGVVGLVAIAAAVSSLSPVQAQLGNQMREGGRFGEGREQMLEQLDLTEAQQDQLQSIRDDAQTQMLNVLTEPQRTELETALEAGEPLPRAVRDLDLSNEQRQQLREIFEASHEAARNIFTDEQRQQLRAMMPERGFGGRGGKGGMMLEQLNLTEQQQAQIDSIRDDAKAQSLNVLTDAQRTELASSLESDEPLHHAMRDLDLSEEQREQLRAIHEASHEAVENVLTDEQREQLETAWAEQGQFRGGPGGFRQESSEQPE